MNAAIAASKISADEERQWREEEALAGREIGNTKIPETLNLGSRRTEQSEYFGLDAAIAASLKTAYREGKQDMNTSNGISTQNERKDKEIMRELHVKAAEERAFAFQNRGIGGKEAKTSRMARRAASQGAASSARFGQLQAAQASSSSPAMGPNDPFVAKPSESSAVDALFTRFSQASSAGPLEGSGLQGGPSNTRPEIPEDLLAVPADVSALDDFDRTFMPSSASGSKMGQDSCEAVDVLASPADVSALYRQDDFSERSASSSWLDQDSHSRVSRRSDRFATRMVEYLSEDDQLNAAIAASKISADEERQWREEEALAGREIGNTKIPETLNLGSRRTEQSEYFGLDAAIAASLKTAYREGKQDMNTSNGISTQNERKDKEIMRELHVKAAEERAFAFQNRGIGGKEAKTSRMARRAASQGAASSARFGQLQAAQASSSSPAMGPNDPFVAKPSESSAVDALFTRFSQASSAGPLEGSGLQGGSSNTRPEIPEDLLAVPADVSALDDFDRTFMPSSASGSKMGQDSCEAVDVLASPADVSALYRQDDFSERSASSSWLDQDSHSRVSRRSDRFATRMVEYLSEDDQLNAAIAASKISADEERQWREEEALAGREIGNTKIPETLNLGSRRTEQSEYFGLDAAIAASLKTAYREGKQDMNTSNGISTQNERKDKEIMRELHVKAAEERAFAFQNRGIGGKEAKTSRMARRAASQGAASSARFGQLQAAQASSSSPAMGPNDPFVAKPSESSAVDALFTRFSQASSAGPLEGSGLQGGSSNTRPEIPEDLLAVPADVSALDDFDRTFMPSSASGSRMGQDSCEAVDVLASRQMCRRCTGKMTFPNHSCQAVLWGAE